jgi:hypothetical protein
VSDWLQVSHHALLPSFTNRIVAIPTCTIAGSSAGDREADLILALGDNAYEIGLDEEYQVTHIRPSTVAQPRPLLSLH